MNSRTGIVVPTMRLCIEAPADGPAIRSSQVRKLIRCGSGPGILLARSSRAFLFSRCKSNGLLPLKADEVSSQLAVLQLQVELHGRRGCVRFFIVAQL